MWDVVVGRNLDGRDPCKNKDQKSTSRLHRVLYIISAVAPAPSVREYRLSEFSYTSKITGFPKDNAERWRPRMAGRRKKRRYLICEYYYTRKNIKTSANANLVQIHLNMDPHWQTNSLWTLSLGLMQKIEILVLRHECTKFCNHFFSDYNYSR
jgi:hypothetical protein